MHILECTSRFRRIERRFNSPVGDLLYQMPRPTLTKWFFRLKIPSQSCRRFTNKNLTSWLYKTGQLKKKPKYNKLIEEPQANVNFFKKWSAEMAYILGYFSADGSVIYGHFIRRDRDNKKTPYISTCFASANAHFLRELSEKLAKNAGMGKGYLDSKSGHLNFSKIDSFKLFGYMYKDISKDQYQYLERKYNKFVKAINFGVVV